MGTYVHSLLSAWQCDRHGAMLFWWELVAMGMPMWISVPETTPWGLKATERQSVAPENTLINRNYDEEQRRFSFATDLVVQNTSSWYPDTNSDTNIRHHEYRHQDLQKYHHEINKDYSDTANININIRQSCISTSRKSILSIAKWLPGHRQSLLLTQSDRCWTIRKRI